MALWCQKSKHTIDSNTSIYSLLFLEILARYIVITVNVNWWNYICSAYNC